MKRIVSFVFCFTLLVALAACSDSGGNSGPKSAVTIESEGSPVNILELVSNQSVNLKAVLKDKSGNLVDNYTTNWMCTEGLGSFSVNNSSETIFTAMNGYFSGSVKSITADCNGVKKTVNVTVGQFSIALSMQGGNTIRNTETLKIKATVNKGGVEDTSIPITWSLSQQEGGGDITPSTYSGEYATYTPPAGSEGNIYIYASANGVTQRSMIINIIR